MLAGDIATPTWINTIKKGSFNSILRKLCYVYQKVAKTIKLIVVAISENNLQAKPKEIWLKAILCVVLIVLLMSIDQNWNVI